jgi:glutathione S-transferase
MSLVLYAAPFSSAIPVVHALKELQVDCEIRFLDLAKGEQKAPEFLALNPNGKVPTLVVNGEPIFEALAILSWLGERYGVERGLWPALSDPKRLSALTWSTWAYVTYGSELMCLSRASNQGLPKERHNAAQTEACRQELERLLGILEQQLSKQPFMLGASFSLVDVVLASSVNYGGLFGIVPNGKPHVAAWLKAFRERPLFAEVWAAAPKHGLS